MSHEILRTKKLKKLVQYGTQYVPLKNQKKKIKKELVFHFIEFHKRTKKNIDTDNMNEVNIIETNNNKNCPKNKCSKKLQTQQRDFNRQQHIS